MCCAVVAGTTMRRTAVVLIVTTTPLLTATTTLAFALYSSRSSKERLDSIHRTDYLSIPFFTIRGIKTSGRVPSFSYGVSRVCQIAASKALYAKFCLFFFDFAFAFVFAFGLGSA